MFFPSEKNNPTAVSQFGWIPGRLVEAAGYNPELKVLAEDVISRYILPLPPASSKIEIDEDEWTRRLLRVVTNGGNPRILQSILLMSGLQSACVSSILGAASDSCSKLSQPTQSVSEIYRVLSGIQCMYLHSAFGPYSDIGMLHRAVPSIRMKLK